MPTKITVIYDTPQDPDAFGNIVFADVEASGEPAASRRFRALSGT